MAESQCRSGPLATEHVTVKPRFGPTDNELDVEDVRLTLSKYNFLGLTVLKFI